MIRADQIPDEVVEAAAKGIIDKLHAYAAQNGLTMNGAEEAIEDFREVAIAALCAGIAAWPGVNLDATRCGTIILHLPKENANAES